MRLALRSSAASGDAQLAWPLPLGWWRRMHVAGCRCVRHALGHEHLELLVDEHERHGRGHTLDRLAESVVAYNIGVMGPLRATYDCRAAVHRATSEAEQSVAVACGSMHAADEPGRVGEPLTRDGTAEVHLLPAAVERLSTALSLRGGRARARRAAGGHIHASQLDDVIVVRGLGLVLATGAGASVASLVVDLPLHQGFAIRLLLLHRPLRPPLLLLLLFLRLLLVLNWL